MKKVWADKKYRNNALDAWLVRTKAGYAIEVVERPPGSVGSVKLPKRWVVERTFAWIGRYRRNSRDYEWYVESSESMIKVCSDPTHAQALESGYLEEVGTVQIPGITGKYYRIASNSSFTIISRKPENLVNDSVDIEPSSVYNVVDMDKRPVEEAPAVEMRELKGLEIAARCRVTFDGTVWLVPSQTTGKTYRVTIGSPPSCQCEDFALRQEPCKHIIAARLVCGRDHGGKSPVVAADAVPVRPTYRQNWPAYNRAQMTEKRRLQVLLPGSMSEYPGTTERSSR